MTSTIYSNPSFSDTPYGLKLRQTIYSSGPVTIPSNIRRVYAVCIGGGGGGGSAINYSTATITNASGNGSTVTYIANNNFLVGSAVSISGVTPTAYNITYQTIISATPTSFTVSNTAVGLYVAGGTAITVISCGAGGGGAGGFSAGWTFAANTCTVGAGGTGSLNGAFNGSRGGDTVYGMVIAGGGGVGRSSSVASPGTPQLGGAAGGGYTDTSSNNSLGSSAGSGVSYTGAPATDQNQIGYASTTGNSRTANATITVTDSFAGVSTAGGSGIAAGVASISVTAGAGGRGVITGGGGSAWAFNTSAASTLVGGVGGQGDRFNGGTGTTTTTPTSLLGGAGGGGAGYLSAGGNAVGNTGGNGGVGGGGGGASNNTARGGEGGQGVIFLYY